MSGIMQYLLCCVWFISLIVTSSRIIRGCFILRASRCCSHSVTPQCSPTGISNEVFCLRPDEPKYFTWNVKAPLKGPRKWCEETILSVRCSPPLSLQWPQGAKNATTFLFYVLRKGRVGEEGRMDTDWKKAWEELWKHLLRPSHFAEAEGNGR